MTTSPASIPALKEALYDGEGQRVVQIAESNGMHTTAAPMAPAQRTLTLRHGRRGPPDASAPDVTEVSAPQQLCRPK